MFFVTIILSRNSLGIALMKVYNKQSITKPILMTNKSIQHYLTSVEGNLKNLSINIIGLHLVYNQARPECH